LYRIAFTSKDENGCKEGLGYKKGAAQKEIFEQASFYF
jgi:hypothetical protein